jgi:mannitol-1-/sugar-/sorbitol-6-phosphatase
MTADATFVLLDVDGTLIDAVANQRRVWQEWARTFELDPDEVYAVALRTRPIDTFAEVAPDLDPAVCLSTLHRLEDHDARHGTYSAFEGAADLLAGLVESRWAVVTSNYAHRVRARFSRTGLRLPEVIVDASFAGPGKPAPDPYLSAADVLGAVPEHCLVLEDSPSGVESAWSAGMRVWAVNTSAPIDRADRTFGTLAEAGPHVLRMHRRNPE